MPFYHSGNLRLHYVCRGPRSPVSPDLIIFQHGIGGDVRQPSRFLMPERTLVRQEDLSVIHADFRGHGESELGSAESLTIKNLASDLGTLLDHLEIPSAILGGISMGAAAALRLAVHHPERCRALVLCRPAWLDGPMSAEARAALSLVAELLTADDWQLSALPALEQSEILRSIEAACPDAAKSLRGQIQSVLTRPAGREYAVARLRHLPFSNGLENIARDLAAVRCPSLILAAEGDPIHPFEYARQLAQFLPNCGLRQIAPKSALDDTPHLEEVDYWIGEFLRSKGLAKPAGTSGRAVSG
jgi:pimeloyl-ACP methyl ester carboxylesterase